jgi:hypothetical protein
VRKPTQDGRLAEISKSPGPLASEATCAGFRDSASARHTADASLGHSIPMPASGGAVIGLTRCTNPQAVYDLTHSGRGIIIGE